MKKELAYCKWAKDRRAHIIFYCLIDAANTRVPVVLERSVPKFDSQDASKRERVNVVPSRSDEAKGEPSSAAMRRRSPPADAKTFRVGRDVDGVDDVDDVDAVLAVLAAIVVYLADILARRASSSAASRSTRRWVPMSMDVARRATTSMPMRQPPPPPSLSSPAASICKRSMPLARRRLALTTHFIISGVKPAVVLYLIS